MTKNIYLVWYLVWYFFLRVIHAAWTITGVQTKNFMSCMGPVGRQLISYRLQIIIL